VQTAQALLKKGYLLLAAVAVLGLFKISKDFSFASSLKQTSHLSKDTFPSLQLATAPSAKGRKLFLDKLLKKGAKKADKWKKYLDIDEEDLNKIKKHVDENIDEVAGEVQHQVDDLIDYAKDHQEQIDQAVEEAEAYYNKTKHYAGEVYDEASKVIDQGVDVAKDVIDEASQAFSDTADDLMDFFSSEFDRFKGKFGKDHKGGKTQRLSQIQPNEQDDDFSPGEDDEGHPEDEEQYANNTKQTQTFNQADLDHIEEDASELHGKSSSLPKTESDDDHEFEVDDDLFEDTDYPWDQEDADDWETEKEPTA
jgi:hypothetical protein